MNRTKLKLVEEACNMSENHYAPIVEDDLEDTLNNEAARGDPDDTFRRSSRSRAPPIWH